MKRSMSQRMSRRHTVFLMDLWATVPYYTAYLAQALRAAGQVVQVGSISYYLDLECYSSRGLRPDPGLLDCVSRMRLPAALRRLLKFLEANLNLLALSVRFLLRPPAVVHVQYLPLLRYGLPQERWFLSLCRARGSRIVLTVHDLLPHDTGQRFATIFQRLYRSMDALICHSEPVRQRLIEEFGIAAEAITVVAHGPFFYDLPTSDQVLNPNGDSALRVLWQGIVLPYKGVDVLLNAWRQVEDAVPNAQLTIAGPCSAPQLDELTALSARLGLAHVRFDSRFVPARELVELYRSADIVVYPYKAITTSGALATGLALGCTIVASDLPVFRELLRDGETALLVPPLNAAALADAIVLLGRDEELRARLAAGVRSMDFGERVWQQIAHQTIGVYERLEASPTASEAGLGAGPR
jgi:glycosyltransferase involved in cell wall biosynthesis